MAKLTKEQQERYGYTDEQVDALKENQIRLNKGIEGLTKYRVVAEVVESNNCGWNAKVGDKIVLTGPAGFCQQNAQIRRICVYLQWPNWSRFL